MKEMYLGDTSNKNSSNPMVDFNYSKPTGKNPQKSMFQMLSPKKNPKNIINNNPKEMFHASNHINSILSKNLISIYHEHKDDIPKDNPLFENVNCLIQKNNDTNKMIYNQMLNLQNNENKENQFISSDVKKPKKRSKKDILSHTIVKDNIELMKKLEKFQMNNPDNLYSIHKGEIKTPKNIGRIGLFGNNKGNSKKASNKNSKQQVINFTNQALLGQNNNSNEFKFSKNKQMPNNKRHNSIAFSPSNNFNNKIKLGSKLNSKIKESSQHSAFTDSSSGNMKKPTLNQINSAITKTFIEDKYKKIRKELADLEKNEISEIISKLPKKLPKNKLEKKKNINLSKMQIIDTNKQVLNDSLKMPLNTQKEENNKDLEDDKIQKKYRKLYLSKNLYDSLDDEENLEDEKVFYFHISPNSLKAYIIDSLILISSLIELYYLPIYISIHIRSFSIYHDIISTVLFCVIDIIYMIDLVTSFFRAYYNFEEVLIKRNADICLHYLTGWFILDLIQAIPFFTLLDKNMNTTRMDNLSSDENKSNIFDFDLHNKYFALTFLKLIKVFKTFTCNRVLKEIYKFLGQSQFFYDWNGIFSSILITVSTLHFSTCFFIFIGRNEFFGWIVKNNLQDKSFIETYVASLYFQMTTLTTVGYGDISSMTNTFELIYGILMLIIGTCAYSWILAYISNYIKKNNEKFIDFEEKVKVLNEVKLEYPNLSQALYDKIKRYLNYNKSESKCNLKFILESLPSSLQNNLIIEIYKPIIMNFQFFKSFENSDFFVKIVTSLKPILSMKDDILIQEGDIIEDIIFIKKGVLSLQVIIDLNDPKKSAESHLEMSSMDCFKSISNTKFNALMNLSTLKTMVTNYKSDFGRKIFNDKDKNKKEIRIIDLRKNEHFGDILMILNEKSPLTVKVKSKKAELFFLQKTEATEISNRYSNIWKRIVNRSLHNMKQIKSLIRKKVLLFIETYNIHINPEIKKRYLIYEQNKDNLKHKKMKKSSKFIETILEEDENNTNRSQSENSEKNMEQSIKEQTQKFQNSEIKNIKENKSLIKKKKEKKVYFKHDEKIKDVIINEKNIVENESSVKESNLISKKNKEKKILKNSKKNISFMKEEKNVEINDNINLSEVNNVINIIDKEVKIANQNNHINTVNINIYTPKVQFPLPEINIENHNSKFSSKIKTEKEKEQINNSINLEQINNEISFNNDFTMDIKDNEIIMNNSDENNKNLYPKIKFEENKGNKHSNISDNNKLNIIKLFKNKKTEKKSSIEQKNDNSEIKTNDKISNKSLSSDKIKLNNKNKKILFSDLNTSQSSSFTISSIYENINQISGFKYHQNSDLREKTKKFIKEEIDKENNENKNKNISFTNTVKKKNNFLDIKTNLTINKKPIMRKKTENISTTIHINKEDDFFSRKKSMVKFSKNKEEFSQISIPKSSKKLNENDKDNVKSDDASPSKHSKHFNSVISKKSNSIKKKPIRKFESYGGKEKTFFNKIIRKKTTKKWKGNTIEEKSEKESKNTKMNYNKIISKNIEKNQQNLNNPEVYFEGFFNDIIFKRQVNGNNLLDDNGVKRRSSLGY